MQRYSGLSSATTRKRGAEDTGSTASMASTAHTVNTEAMDPDISISEVTAILLRRGLPIAGLTKEDVSG